MGLCPLYVCFLSDGSEAFLASCVCLGGLLALVAAILVRIPQAYPFV
jgi:hypothetical protein